MRHPPFEEPRLFVTRADALPISGQALLDLMREVLARGRPFRFRARGWSMTPFIRDGDVVTVAPLGGGRPSVGEVVAFQRPETGRVVVHCVIAQAADGCFIQGDGGPACEDGLIPGENVLGRVTRVQRDGRDIWLGLGPERVLIAWLSRTGRLAGAARWLPGPIKALLR